MTQPAATTREQTIGSLGADRPCELIAIAASAGGLAALREVLGGLPAQFDVPIVVVQHRSTSNPDRLPAILSRAVPWFRVKQAEDGDVISPKTVYVAPPDFHLVVRHDHTIGLEGGRRIKFLRSSANPLLESAASALEGRLIAVVLTGGGSDATDGVQTVKSKGGIVIAQNPRHAEHPSMPMAAIQTGAVDYVLELDDIAPMLLQLAKTNSVQR
jgi:two-component system chemotaxis response regulator CheB